MLTFYAHILYHLIPQLLILKIGTHSLLNCSLISVLALSLMLHDDVIISSNTSDDNNIILTLHIKGSTVMTKKLKNLTSVFQTKIKI